MWIQKKDESGFYFYENSFNHNGKVIRMVIQSNAESFIVNGFVFVNGKQEFKIESDSSPMIARSLDCHYEIIKFINNL